MHLDRLWTVTSLRKHVTALHSERWIGSNESDGSVLRL